jgi:hypothetical protein
MARFAKFIAALGAITIAAPLTASGQTGTDVALRVQLNSQAVGNTATDYLSVTSENHGVVASHAVPPRRLIVHCYWSSWTLYRVNSVTHERTYGVYIYDGCNHDAQVFPVPTDIRQGSCNNDDNLYPSGKFSVCPIIEQGHVPAGLPFDRHCEALTEADTSLFVDVSPPTYDATKPTALTATTSFASDMTQRLAEGTCTDVLDWRVVSWTLRWSDGAVDHLPASGQSGITTTHELKPTQGSGTQQADVTVVARLHVIGQALDFDASGNPVVRGVDGYVDISNHDGAAGTGSAPVDEPPQMAVGAIAVGQQGDGSLPQPDETMSPAQRAVTIRGRLLALYVRPVLLRPGVELIDGAEVGVATSRVLRWHYLGGSTDAPPSEGTTPGARGDAATPIVVQYDHAERIDALGRPVDETVPVEMTVRSVYPDGTVLDTTMSGSIAVAIYYAGLTGTG